MIETTFFKLHFNSGRSYWVFTVCFRSCQLCGRLGATQVKSYCIQSVFPTALVIPLVRNCQTPIRQTLNQHIRNTWYSRWCFINLVFATLLSRHIQLYLVQLSHDLSETFLNFLDFIQFQDVDKYFNRMFRFQDFQ